MFRRDVSPVETNLRNVAQERDFHGNPNDFLLERTMSVYESRFAPVIRELRLGLISEAAIPTICEFAVHIMVRTKNIRAGFVEATKTFLGQFGEALPTMDPKKWKNKVKKVARKQMREAEVRDQMRKIPKAQRRLFTRALEKQICDIDYRPLVSDLFNSVCENLDFKKIANSGHIQALNKAIAPQPKLESVSHLQWQLVTSDQHSFILGDVGIFGRCEGELAYRNLVGATPCIEILIVPVSHSVCLFGTSRTVELPQSDEINVNSAQLSREFFLASQSTEREARYHTELGKRAALISDEELSNIVAEIT
jgi:hypothetical protein